MLDNAEQEHENAVHDCFIQRGQKQWPALEPLSQPDSTTDQYDLGDDEGLDQGEAVVQVREPELLQDKSAVDRERAQEQGKVERDDPVDFEFLQRPLLQALALGGFRVHVLCIRLVFDVDQTLSSSSARIGTPRLHACTPCTTQSFRTSMISSIMAPAFNAFRMCRRVPGAYICV